jgi:hypothetical protein
MDDSLLPLDFLADPNIPPDNTFIVESKIELSLAGVGALDFVFLRLVTNSVFCGVYDDLCVCSNIDSPCAGETFVGFGLEKGASGNFFDFSVLNADIPGVGFVLFGMVTF